MVETDYSQNTQYRQKNWPNTKLKKRSSQRYREIFAQVSPQLINEHYNWFIVIEPNSGDYFVDIDEEIAVQKARHKYPTGMIGIMRLSETGTCGKI
nr:hypothetical protein [Trichocoleus sp. FACHB-40]